MEMRSLSHLGRDFARQMLTCRLLNAASSQVTWRPGLGFVRQISCSVWILPGAHFLLLQFLLLFCSLSYVQLAPYFISHHLYYYHQSCLMYHLMCSVGSIKDAVKQSLLPLFDKEETEACNHKAIQWPSWALTPMSVLILWFLEGKEPS